MRYEPTKLNFGIVWFGGLHGQTLNLKPFRIKELFVCILYRFWHFQIEQTKIWSFYIYVYIACRNQKDTLRWRRYGHILEVKRYEMSDIFKEQTVHIGTKMLASSVLTKR